MSIQFNSLPVIPLRITSKFGPRNTGIKGASTYHKGIDLGRNKALAETQICAVADGVVASNYWNKYRGWVIIIQHNGFLTLYQHLKAQSVLKVGITVKSGQQLGIMGNSSDKSVLSVAVHLHMELIVGGKQVDPEPYLKNIKEDEEVEVKPIKIEINGAPAQIPSINYLGREYMQVRALADADKGDKLEVKYDAERNVVVISSK